MYIKKAPLKPFLSLIELDYGTRELKKERQKARKKVWEYYFKIVQQHFNIPAITIISELTSRRNSLFRERNRNPVRSETIGQTRIDFMEVYCRKMGIHPSAVDFVDGYTPHARIFSQFSDLHFRRKYDRLYFNTAKLTDSLEFQYTFLHELGHMMAGHAAIGTRLNAIFGKKRYTIDIIDELERVEEFMAHALVALIDTDASRTNLQYSMKIFSGDIQDKNYLTNQNLFILYADIALLHGITIQECCNEDKVSQEDREKLLDAYKKADEHFFTQDDNYSIPRFLPEILSDYLKIQGILSK